PIPQSKPDWMIATLIAKEMGVDLGSDFSASGVFKTLADATLAYNGLRYPALKDESDPVQAKYDVASRDVSGAVDDLRKRVESLGENGEKKTDVPKVGHRLHRLTTMTSKTPQLHLLAHGNPKPENLLVSPLVQFNKDGSPSKDGFAEAATVGVGDREDKGGR
ncbi:MAG: hypothetical protein ACREO5_05665, partial [Candidatus Binatia bacterium]